jgi:hypothetical protein
MLECRAFYFPYSFSFQCKNHFSPEKTSTIAVTRHRKNTGDYAGNGRNAFLGVNVRTKPFVR